MRLTLFTFCIYLLYCGLAFCGGLFFGFMASTVLLQYIGMGDYLVLRYIVAAVCGLFCAFLGLGPAFITHFLYTVLCEKLPAFISSEITSSQSSSSESVKDK